MPKDTGVHTHALNVARGTAPLGRPTIYITYPKKEKKSAPLEETDSNFPYKTRNRPLYKFGYWTRNVCGRGGVGGVWGGVGIGVGWGGGGVGVGGGNEIGDCLGRV